MRTLPGDATRTEPESVSVASIQHQLEQSGADPAAILRSVIHSPAYADFSASLRGQEAHEFIEILDRTISSTYENTDLFQEFRRLCGRTGLLPSSHMLLQRLAKSGDQPTASGGFGDVWKGVYHNHRVAIKALRVYSTNDIEKIKKKFCKEVVIWKRLSHPNVVRFLGVSTTLFPLAMISEWMPQGNIRQYVRSNPETNRLKLLTDIGEGLYYLHSSNVVHGDLKGDNILVNEDGWAALCDFGFTSIATSLNATTSASSARGSIRWMAPELFDMEHAGPEITRPSEASDIYALGMVIMEVFTGQLPFHTHRHDSQVIFKVISGARPIRPLHTLELGLSDPLWELVEMCWNADRTKRPSAAFVLDRLRHSDPGVSLLPFIQDFDPSSKESIRTLRSALSSRDDVLLQLHGKDAYRFIDVLDKAMDSPHADEELSRKCLRALRRICGRTGFLPTSYTLPDGRLTKTGDLAFDSGGFADVWEGMYDNIQVRIKSLRINLVVDLGRVKTRFCSEAAVWKRLRHPNVVPFLGVSTTLDPLCIVSPWMPNGNIIEYLSSNSGADRLNLLVDVAKGLKYLHSNEVVHGNLKGADILIDENGVARLSDFGLASIANETLNESTSEAETYLSTRWMAPEFLDPENSGIENDRSSKASDIYSFAMVVIEVFTGNVPFYGYRKEGVIVRVVEGKRPERPEQAVDLGLSDAVWDLVEICWQQEREKRPTISNVLRSLRKAANLDPPTPTMEFTTVRPRSLSDGSTSSFMKSPGRDYLSKDDIDDSSKSFAQMGNNFGPTPVTVTRSSGPVFRSLILPDVPDPEDSTWTSSSNFTVEERASSVGVRNDVISSTLTVRPIKARRVGGKRQIRKSIVAPSLRRDLGMSEESERDEQFDADWGSLNSGAPPPALGEKPRSRGRWPGEVAREIASQEPEEVIEPPPTEANTYSEVNEQLSFGGYAQW